MIKDLFDIFTECFPSSLISKEEFEKKLDINDANVIKAYNENNSLIGYSIVRENCISLLCVKPDFQKRGYGTKLLLDSEERIKDAGFKEILLGYKTDKTSLYMGVPILNNNNYEFFTKHQYDSDFNYYDVSLPNSNDWKNPSNDNEYVIVNTLKYPNVKNLFYQLLKITDKKIYERYVLDENVNFVFCTKDNKLLGVCAFKVAKDFDTILIFDMVSYPNFNINSKKAMLSEVGQTQIESGIDKICVKNVSNPIFYQQEFQGNIKQKYWRGSKPC